MTIVGLRSFLANFYLKHSIDIGYSETYRLRFYDAYSDCYDAIHPPRGLPIDLSEFTGRLLDMHTCLAEYKLTFSCEKMLRIIQNEPIYNMKGGDNVGKKISRNCTFYLIKLKSGDTYKVLPEYLHVMKDMLGEQIDGEPKLVTRVLTMALVDFLNAAN